MGIPALAATEVNFRFFFQVNLHSHPCTSRRMTAACRAGSHGYHLLMDTAGHINM